MTKLYNEDIKEEFLNLYDNENTKSTMRHLFIKSAETEFQKEKDLYDFTLEEISEIMYELNPITANSARTYGRFINYYIDWTIDPKGYRKGNVSPLSGKDVYYFDNFVDTSLKLLFSEDEINHMVSNLMNFQDKVILQLIFFEGIEGDALSELLNIRESDIDFGNCKIQLHDDDKGSRVITVSQDSIDIIKGALEERIYKLKNGEAKGWKKASPLVENDYVVKSNKGKAINLTRAAKHLIYRRFSTIGEYFNYKYLTSGNVRKSGMIKMAKDLYIRDGELDKDQLDEISERFNLSKVKVGDAEVPNYFVLKEFINLENIRELYPEESIKWNI